MRLAFVELRVRDLDAAVTWYHDVLGLKVLVRDEANGFVLMRAGESQLALKHGDPSPGAALLAFEVDDLAIWLTRLEEKGVPLDGPVTESAEGYRRARICDLDRHPVILFEWRHDR